MGDDKFLQQIINSVSTVAAAIPDYIVGVKNIDSDHVYVSPSLQRLTGIKFNPEHPQISFWIHYSVEDIRKDDLWIMENRKTKSFLVVDKFGGEIIPRIFVKRPLINPDTNNLIGVFYQSFDYTQFNIIQEISRLFSKKVETKASVDEVSTEYKLSPRQKQVVFFFLSNLNSQEIADFISTLNKKSITKSTIDSIFSEQLYDKFDVVNRIELRQKLLDLGFDKMIPKNLILPLVSKSHSCVLL